jgi:Domain of unknown function (DUF927)
VNEHLLPSYQILALGRSGDGDRFLKIEVRLRGQPKVPLLSMRDLQASPDKTINQLGAPPLTRAARTRFLEKAEQAFQTLEPKFRVATKPGLSRGVFILPNGTCVPRTDGLEVCLPQELRVYGDKFGCLGTLRGWKRIPELARGNTRLMLAVALAFTGPVVEALRLEPPMIQLFGDPGSGKTSTGAAVGSVWGGGDDGLFLQSWNHTANSAERLAAAFHSTFLVMDEPRTADQSQAGKTPAILQLIMRLAGGQMRGRLTDVFAPLRFETPLLSLSNESLDEMAQKWRAEIDDAHRGRLIDVPLAPGVVGAFERLHGFENHAAFSIELRKIARSHHGSAAREFLRRFAASLREDKPSIVASLQERRAMDLARRRRSVVSASRDLERIHQKLATIYAAGILAINYGILPWRRWELLDALVACERAHVDHVAQFTPVSSAAPARPTRAVVDPLERLRAHYRQNRSNFVDLRDGLLDQSSDHDHDSCAGYVNRGSDGSTELLFTNAVLLRLCGGFAQVQRLKRELEDSGWLIRDSNRPLRRRNIWKGGGRGNRVLVTTVREEAFGDYHYFDRIGVC